jgi:hypothetical protein
MNLSRFIKRLAFAAVFLAVFLSAQKTNAQVPRAGEEVYLKAFYALDEPRFLCVDIPGHKDRVDTARPLVVHTCKEGIWHKDELFDRAAVSKGQLRMPEYNLCVIADSTEEGARLSLQDCGSALGTWAHANYRLRLKAHPKMCLTIGPGPSKLTPGGRRLPSRNMARSLTLAICSDEAFQRQLWRFEAPLKRSGSVMPMK